MAFSQKNSSDYYLKLALGDEEENKPEPNKYLSLALSDDTDNAPAPAQQATSNKYLDIALSGGDDNLPAPPEPVQKDKGVGFWDVAKSLFGAGERAVAGPVSDLGKSTGDAGRRFGYTPHAIQTEMKAEESMRDAAVRRAEYEAAEEKEYEQVGQEAADAFRPLEASLAPLAETAYALGKREFGKAAMSAPGALGMAVLDLLPSSLFWSGTTTGISAATKAIRGDTDRGFLKEWTKTKPGFLETAKSIGGPDYKPGTAMKVGTFIGDLAFPGAPTGKAAKRFGRVLNSLDNIVRGSADEALEMAIKSKTSAGFYMKNGEIRKVQRMGDDSVREVPVSLTDFIDDTITNLDPSARGYKQAKKELKKDRQFLDSKDAEKVIGQHAPGELLTQYRQASDKGKRAMGAAPGFLGTQSVSRRSVNKFWDDVTAGGDKYKKTVRQSQKEELLKQTSEYEKLYGEEFVPRLFRMLDEIPEAKAHFQRVGKMPNIVDLARGGTGQKANTKAIMDEFGRLLERTEQFRYKRTGAMPDQVLAPGDDFSQFLEFKQYDPNDPLDQVARVLNDNLRELNRVEREAGVGSTYRWKFKDEVEAEMRRVAETAIESDDAFRKEFRTAEDAIDAFKKEINSAIDKYETPEHFAVSRAWQDMEVGGKKIFGRYSWNNFKQKDLFAGPSKRNYVPRYLNPGLHEKLSGMRETLADLSKRTKLLYAMSKKGGFDFEAQKLLKFADRVDNHIAPAYEAANSGVAASFREARTDAGQVFSSLEMDRAFQDELRSAVEHLDDWKSLEDARAAALKALDKDADVFIRNDKDFADFIGQRKELASQIRGMAEDGALFDYDILENVMRRGRASARVRSTNNMVMRMVDDPRMVAHPKHGMSGKPEYSGWFKDNGAPVYSLKKAVPGLPEKYADYAINPDIYGLLKSTHNYNNNADSSLAKAYLAYETMHHWLRPVLLAMPKTGIRNFLDANLKNILEFTPGENLSGMNYAIQLLNTDRVMSRKTGQMLAGEDVLFVNKIGSVMDRMLGKVNPIGIDEKILTGTGEYVTMRQILDEVVDLGVLSNRKTRYGMEVSRKGLGERISGVKTQATPAEQKIGKIFGEKAQEVAANPLVKKLEHGASLKLLSDFSLSVSAKGDDLARLSNYLTHRIVRGENKMASAIGAHSSHWGAGMPDDLFYNIYSRVTDNPGKAGELAARAQKHAENIFTFWTFTRNNIPYWWKMLSRNPRSMSAIPKMRERAQQEAGIVGYLPYDEFEDTPYQTSPFPVGLGMTKKGGLALDYYDLSSALSMFPALGQTVSEGAANPMTLASPVIQGATGLIGSSMTGFQKYKDPFFGRDYRGEKDVLREIGGKFYPPAQWFQRPLEAAGVLETSGRYPLGEDVGEAMMERFIKPWSKRSLSLGYQANEISRRLRKLEDEGKMGTKEWFDLANAEAIMDTFK